MALSRATKTFTSISGVQILGDAYTDEANPTVNNDLNGLSTGGTSPTDRHRSFLIVKIPDAPSDVDKSQPYEGIVAIRVALKLYAITAGSPNPWSHDLGIVGATFDETTLTWNNQPTLTTVIENTSISTAATGFKLFGATGLRVYKWAGQVPISIRAATGSGAHWLSFNDRTAGAIADMPYLEVDYLQTPPVQITDLKLSPDANDETRPLLTWTASKDERFSKYQVFRKVGAGAYAQVGSDITVQGQSTFVDTSGGLTENSVVLYKVREVNVDGSYNESNEVWMIRPDVSTFTVDDTTPDVNQRITATITAVAYGTTPTPVTNTDYYYEWGSGSEYDTGSALVKDASRPHIWPAAGSQTPKCQIRNSQGFRSDKTSLTTGGPTLTVASIAPVAKLKAAPMVQLTNTDVRFYGDESYAPAVNKTINVANGYEWDQDYVAGPFVADFTTTLPYKDVQWSSAGTKRLALRVKDQDGVYSPVVTIDLDIITSVVVNLDNLVDGFDVLDHDEARQTFVYEGVDATEMAQAGKRPHSVTIGGFAFTDANADNVPDDVATLADVINNLKKVQLTVLNVVRTGMLRSGIKVHTEGGWALKYNWSVDIALDP